MGTFDFLKQSVAGNPEMEKLVQQREQEHQRRMSEIRHMPRRNPVQIRTPSALADLDGSRRPGQKIKVYTAGKVPKRRFNIGDLFEYDGTTWAILYMYRLKSEPGVWYHCLEECKVQVPVENLGGRSMLEVFEILGAGATTPRIVEEPFRDWSDASRFFSDIYRGGDSTTKTTQQLLSMKKL